MWLKNTRNDTYYPYSEFLAKHSGMIKVYDNPFEDRKETELEKPVLVFDDEPIVEEVVEDVEIKEVELVPEEVAIKTEVFKPKKVVKRTITKPKPKAKK